MRYKGYAVSYADEQLKVNKENFFINGVCREDLERLNVFQMNKDFGRRNFYAVASGAKCDEAGDEISQVAVDVLKGFYGSDFAEDSRAYFGMANSAVTGHVFERKHGHFEVDISLLYIENDIATIYSFGDMPAFYYRDDKLEELSGQSPTTVEVEKVVLDKKGIAKLQKLRKHNIPYIGFLGEECESVPYVSKSIELKHKGFFVLCSKALTEVISERDIKEILDDSKIKGGNKATYIIDRAVKKNPKGNYTVLVVQVENGIPVAEAEMKSLSSWVLVAVLCAVLYFTSSYVLRGLYLITEGAKSFIGNLFDTEEEPNGNLRWTPKEEAIPAGETDGQQVEQGNDVSDQSDGNVTSVTERSGTGYAPISQPSSVSPQENADESDAGQTSETTAKAADESDEMQTADLTSESETTVDVSEITTPETTEETKQSTDSN